MNTHRRGTDLEDRLELARQLADALARHECGSLHEYLEQHELSVPRNAHSWEEIQTVLSAHRLGRPTTAQPAPRTTHRTRRANMYEPDLYTTDTGDGEIDPHEFTYATVGVTNSAREAFGGDTTSLLILLGCAVRHGEYRPGRDGAHKFSYRDHRFVVSADGNTLIAYAQRDRDERRVPDRHNRDVVAKSLEETGFDPEQVAIRPGVLNAFGNKHGVDDGEAEEEIRSFLAWALASKKHRVLKNGCHLFNHQGFKVWVSPDGQSVSKYETLHIERTPKDVQDGVPSRFAQKR